MEKIVDAKEDRLIDFLNKDFNGKSKNQVYEIPCYQRSFSWVNKHCRTLFNDIHLAYTTGTAYFVGSFIYYEKENERDSYFLVDGQQRLTSIMLMLSALGAKCDDIKKDIEKDFISIKKGKKNKLKLKQNNCDYDIFAKIVTGKIDEVQNKKSKLVKAYYTFKELIEEKGINDPYKFYETVKNLFIIRIRISNDDTLMIQKLFEKLNSTGKELSQSDLIRNHLLTVKTSEEQSKLYNKWNTIERITLNGSLDNLLKSYVVLNLSNDYKVISYEDIYERFVKVTRKKSRDSILDELIDFACYYRFIDDCTLFTQDDSGQFIEDPDYNKNDKRHNGYRSIKTLVALLKNIGTTEEYPFFIQILKMYEKKSDFDEVKKILDTFLDFIIRYRITGTSKGGALLNTVVRKYMDKITRNPKLATSEKLYSHLSTYNTPDKAKIYPSDEQFKNRLMEGVDTNNAKVLLYQLERKRDSKGIEVNFADITLEHIMPQKIESTSKSDKTDSEYWIKHLGGKRGYSEFHDKYLWCIGNLALLSCSKNKCKKYSNKKWPDKRILLKNDKFLYTQELSTNKQWNKTTILERNDKFSSKICKIIRGPK